jgi:VanZ family protein
MGFQGLRKDFWRRYGATIAWAALLFALSSMPDLVSPVHASEWDDKYEHLLAYLPLGWLLMRSISWNGKANNKALWLTVMIGLLYGISDELHQHFVPGRMMDWKDVVADFVGIALGGLLFLRWPGRRSAVKEKSEAATRQRVRSVSK